ncbi:MAG TPA: TonB-dependent receptor, partial [Terriglobia bacterium]
MTGVIRGPRGAVSGAEVVLLQGGATLRTTTADADGTFRLESVSPGAYQIQVSSPPLLPSVQDFLVTAGGDVELQVVLNYLSENVTVTATRLPVPAVTAVADVEIMTGDDLREMPYQSLDDGLRTFPEFSLFRRSSSLVAHPTTQGVSLRGIGPSGVSRSLVLVDGVPLNDAFGGWVYWDRIPLLSLQQVEVAKGSGSSLYGNYALGGVVQLIKRVPQPATFEALFQGGSRNSLKADVYASHRHGPWGFSATGSFFDFDGYTLVAKAQRGAVDIPAFSQHQAMRFQTEWAPAGGSWMASLEGGLLNEERGNGTPLQNNDTDSFDWSLGAQWSRSSQDRLQTRAFFRRSVFVNNAAGVAADRNSESLASQQHNPSADGGVSLLWLHSGNRRSFVAGSDVWIVSGRSTDNVFQGTPAVFTRVRLGGGKQATTGFFGEANVPLFSHAMLAVGGRVDVWRNFDGFQGNYLVGSPVTTSVASNSGTEFSPRVGLTYQFERPLTLHAVIFRSFRAPTLNELYRISRVGNTTTNGNPALKPEHATGGELGARYRIADQVSTGITWFMNVLDKPVSNVTLDPNPANTIQQRQNLGRAR